PTRSDRDWSSDVCSSDLFAFIQYVALEQLDALALDGSSRALAGFSRIAEEADEYGNKMFESYVQSVGEGDPGDFADTARDQAVRSEERREGKRVDLEECG